MLTFNFNSCYRLTFALMFVQDSIIAEYSQTYRNFQCVTYHLYDTSTVKIILKDVPKNYEIRDLQCKALKHDSGFRMFYPNRSNSNETYYEFDVVVYLSDSEPSLTVHLFDGENTKRVPIIKYILETDRHEPVHNCSSHCTIEFDDWSIPSVKSVTTELINEEKAAACFRNQKTVKGYQRIEYQWKDVVNMSVVITNLPSQTHFVDLYFKNLNPILKNGVVLEHSCEFKDPISFDLFTSFNGSAILIKLKDQNGSVFESREIAILIYNPNNAASKHPCLNKCFMEYDYNKKADTANKAVCPKVETPISTESINHYIRQQPYVTTTIPNTKEATTIPNTKEATNTLTDSGYKLSIILPSVAIGVLILISCIALYIMYKRKKPKNENDNTYLYVTPNQLNYAELDLQSSELYEAPTNAYVSAYTRIIGTLISK